MKIKETLRSIVNPSGGLAYHYSALRHRSFHWLNYTTQINDWLESWTQNQGSLLLLGPSAGYSLSTRFLEKFERIDAIDPDPLGRYLFARNHPLQNFQWHDRDDLGVKTRSWNPTGLNSLLEDFPDHKILFCNFLGQLPSLFPELTHTKPWDHWRGVLHEALAKKKWASYHDLYSLQAQIRTVDRDVLKKWERNQENAPEQYLQELFPKTSRRKAPVVIDHCTHGLFPQGRRHLFLWQRLPKYLHIIEARRSV